MKLKLSHAFEPPAPVVRIRVLSVASGDAAELEAKLDTGADICALPDAVVAALDLQPTRMVRAAGFAGTLQEVPVYRAHLEIAGRRLSHVEAVATRRIYGIVGRNVLRELILRIDGPREQLELRWPKALKRKNKE